MGEEKRKFRKIYVLLAVIVLAVFCLFFFRVTEVTVEGNTFYSQSQMAQIFQEKIWERNILTFGLMDKLSMTPELPYVREYEITFPSVNHVHIKLYEKTIVAGIAYTNQYIYFDNEGTVLKSTSEPERGIPLFQTNNLTTFTLYSKVKMENGELLEQILDLANLLTHYNIEWDTARFNSKNEATLYVGGKIVRLGKRTDYDEPISALAGILEQMDQGKMKKMKGTIDLTDFDAQKPVVFSSDSKIKKQEKKK